MCKQDYSPSTLNHLFFFNNVVIHSLIFKILKFRQLMSIVLRDTNSCFFFNREPLTLSTTNFLADYFSENFNVSKFDNE